MDCRLPVGTAIRRSLDGSSKAKHDKQSEDTLAGAAGSCCVVCRSARARRSVCPPRYERPPLFHRRPAGSLLRAGFSAVTMHLHGHRRTPPNLARSVATGRALSPLTQVARDGHCGEELSAELPGHQEHFSNRRRCGLRAVGPRACPCRLCAVTARTDAVFNGNSWTIRLRVCAGQRHGDSESRRSTGPQKSHVEVPGLQAGSSALPASFVVIRALTCANASRPFPVLPLISRHSADQLRTNCGPRKSGSLNGR